MSAPASADEIVVNHVSARGRAVTAVRGTLVLSALQGLKDGGVFASFLQELAEPLHAPVLGASALSWVPVEHLVEMCLAVDRLKLTDRELSELGGSAGASIGATVLSVLLRSAGATPWTVLSTLDRLWDRFYEGGGITVLRTGPKDAFIELSGLPHAVSRYSRATTYAFFQALAAKLVRTVYVTAARTRVAAPTNVAFTLSWA